MLLRSILTLGLLVVLAVVASGCSLRDEEATPTPSNVFVIVTPTPGTPPPSTSTEGRPAVYVVQPGDNLSDIADELGVSTRALQDANGIDDPDSIFAGQELVVPTITP